MYTSTVALWRAGAAVLSYTQNKISSHLAPGKNVGFTYDGCRWRPQIFDIRYLFISLLSDLCCSAELPEVEIISLIEEKIPRYKLRADSAISFTGNIILLFTFSLVFFFLSFLYNSSFFFTLQHEQVLGPAFRYVNVDWWSTIRLVPIDSHRRNRYL